MKPYVYLWFLAEFLLECEMFDIKVVQKIKTHFMSSNIFSEYRAVYEVIWKNMVQPDRPQLTV